MNKATKSTQTLHALAEAPKYVHPGHACVSSAKEGEEAPGPLDQIPKWDSSTTVVTKTENLDDSPQKNPTVTKSERSDDSPQKLQSSKSVGGTTSGSQSPPAGKKSSSPGPRASLSAVMASSSSPGPRVQRRAQQAVKVMSREPRWLAQQTLAKNDWKAAINVLLLIFDGDNPDAALKSDLEYVVPQPV